MQLLEFFKLLESVTVLEQHPAIILRAEAYSAFFFSRLFTFLQKHKQLPLVPINVSEKPYPEAHAELTSLFLGNKRVYWFSDFSQADQQTQAKWHAFIQSYTGPHNLIVFISKSVEITFSPATLTVDIPQYISGEMFKNLYTQLYCPHVPGALLSASATSSPSSYRGGSLGSSQASSLGVSVDPVFIAKLTSFHKNLLLDDACRIMSYYQVLGRRYEQFLTEWLDKLIVPETSLFTLSQYLFAQDKTQFLHAWSRVQADYPPEFWVVYWSEQIAQAAVFVTAVQTRNPQDAKKLVHRLPFSFMNKDWKRYTPGFLAQAHNFLYNFDYGLKNGISSDWGIELWHYKFLAGSF